jgi:hypothetical protein
LIDFLECTIQVCRCGSIAWSLSFVRLLEKQNVKENLWDTFKWTNKKDSQQTWLDWEFVVDVDAGCLSRLEEVDWWDWEGVCGSLTCGCVDDDGVTFDCGTCWDVCWFWFNSFWERDNHRDFVSWRFQKKKLSEFLWSYDIIKISKHIENFLTGVDLENEVWFCCGDGDVVPNTGRCWDTGPSLVAELDDVNTFCTFAREDCFMSFCFWYCEMFNSYKKNYVSFDPRTLLVHTNVLQHIFEHWL